MKKINVEDAKEVIKGTKYIGHGTTAKCYLTASNDVVKIFKDNYRTYELFKYKDGMEEHVEKLSELNNDSYLAPISKIMTNDKLIGYITPYGGKKTFDKINKNMSFELFNHLLNKLIEDTYLVSKKGFRIADLHDRNILISDCINIIDLDHGYFYENVDTNRLFEQNINSIIYIIINSILGCHNTTNKNIRFTYLNYEEMYDKLLKGKCSFELFYRAMSEKLELDNPSIGEFSKNAKKVLSYQTVYDYYRHF